MVVSAGLILRIAVEVGVPPSKLVEILQRVVEETAGLNA